MAFASLTNREKQVLFHDKKTEIIVRIEHDEIQEREERRSPVTNREAELFDIDFFTTPTLIEPGENYQYDLNVTLPTEESIDSAPTITSSIIQSAYRWEGIAQGVQP